LVSEDPGIAAFFGFKVGASSPNLGNSLLFSLLAGNLCQRPVRYGLRRQAASLDRTHSDSPRCVWRPTNR